MLRKILFITFIFSAAHSAGVCQDEKTFSIPFYKTSADVLEVDVKVNGSPARFIFDSGATTISFGMEFYRFLQKNGYISNADVKSKTSTRMANGLNTDAIVINLKNLTVGDFEMHNVEALVLNEKNAPYLIGQNVLKKFSTLTIDYSRNRLILKQKRYSGLSIQLVKYVPCSQRMIAEAEKISGGISSDEINIQNQLTEQHVPPPAGALKRITHRLTIRYFDPADMVKAQVLGEKLLEIGYSSKDIYIEDMSFHFSKPISNYFELWIK